MKFEHLVQMVEPKRAFLSDLDSRYEVPRRPWPCVIGWLLGLLVIAIPIVATIYSSLETERRELRDAREMRQMLETAAKEQAKLAALRKEIEAIEHNQRIQRGQR